MKDKKRDFTLVVMFLEVIVVVAGCLLIRGKLVSSNRVEGVTKAVTPTVTVTTVTTPTGTITTCTPLPTNTPTPTPWPGVTKSVDPGHTFKPYTRYTAYNVIGSTQRRLQIASTTDERTGIRVVTDHECNPRYCVALGTHWAGAHPEHIGRYVDVVMENGCVLKCVLGDVKRQEDTKGKQNKYGAINNDMLEFIVDEKKLSAAVKACGNVSKAGPEFEGDVKEIIVYDLYIEGFGTEQ